MPPRRRTGGNLAGYGSYGCVFVPGPTCYDKAGRTLSPAAAGTAVKVFAKQWHADEEMQHVPLLDRLDPSGRMFVRPLRSCHVRTDELFDAAQDALRPPGVRHAKCPILVDALRQRPPAALPPTLPAVQLAAGAADLYTLLAGNPGRVSRAQLADLLSGAASGLKALADHDWVHGDVKSPNVLVVQMPGGNLETRLIDFGFLMPAIRQVRLSTFQYYAFPPEYRGDELLASKSLTDVLRLEKMCLRSFDAGFVDWVLTRPEYQASLRRLMAARKSSSAIPSDRFAVHIQPRPHRVDVYGLGVLLLDALPHLPPASADAEAQAYVDLLHRCMMPHPHDRPSMDEVLDALWMMAQGGAVAPAPAPATPAPKRRRTSAAAPASGSRSPTASKRKKTTT